MATALQAELAALAVRQRTRIQRLGLAARIAFDRIWNQLDPAALTQSWDAGLNRRALVTLSGAQLAAAQGAEPFVAATMATQGLDPDNATGTFLPESLAGFASDGRPLASLLYQPLIDVKVRIGQGETVDEAMRIGRNSLDLITDTQITDAARVAVGAVGITKPQIQWYVRTLTPPSCARCAILAGKVTSVEKAFQRHPKCDCVNTMVGDPRLARELITSPTDYFNSLSSAEQDRIFTKAGAAAINDGADIFQIVNARRGMSAAGDARFTTEGMSRRGLAGQGLRSTPGARRLTPEAIYALSSDRAEILRLLRRFGYLS